MCIRDSPWDMPNYFSHRTANQKSSEMNFLAACAFGTVAAVRNLVRQGVDINYRDEDGRSGLMLTVCRAQGGHYNIVVFLLSLPGISVNLTTITGDTVLQMAALHNRREIVRELLKRSDIRLDMGPVSYTHLTLPTKA